MVDVVLTLLVGFVTGVLSGMFGIGGAVLSTPAIRLLGVSAFEAIGTTLPSILPASVSGSLRYRREGLIHARVVVWTVACGVPASVVGSRLSHTVPGDGHILMLVTAGLVAWTAFRTVVPAKRTLERADEPPRTDWWRLGVIGLAAGGLSGLLGVGGGIIMVPLFLGWVGVPLREAIGSSLACVGILAIPGTITHAALGDINWPYAIALAIGVVPGAQLGAHFTLTASERTLRVAVATVLAVIAVIFAVGETIALVG